MLVYSATLLGVGTQFLCLGILAELVTSYNIRRKDMYSIREVLSKPAGPPNPDRAEVTIETRN